MYGKLRTIMTLFVIASFCFSQTPVFAAQAKAMTDTGYIGNDQWICDSDGDLVPASDSSQDLGASGSEVDNIYVDSLWMGGVEKTSWGSVVSPMTDATGYVYPTDSGGVYRLYDAGYLALGAGTAIDSYILLDTNGVDFHIGHDETDGDFAIGCGSTLGTDERITVNDSATLTLITIGDGVDAEDKYIVFDGNLGDQYLGYLDTYDMLIAGDGSTMDADMCWGVENAATPKLVLWNGIDGYGAIDIDYGSADITDHSFISDGGTTILDGAITIGDNGELITNATDDTIRIASDDADTILEVYTAFETTGDATLKLSADLGDEAGEQWTITSTGATTDLVFGCDDTASGTPLTRFTISDAGVVTTMGTVNLEIDDSANTTVTDIVNIQHFTSGTAAAGIGAGLTFDLENAAGTEEEHAYIDVVSTTATDGAEDTDIVMGVMTAGTLAEVFRIVAASSATTGDSVTITQNTTETDGIIDILSLANVTGTATHNAGLGITWDFEDASGAEEQASLDVQLTTATNGAEDVAIIFSGQTAGAVAEMFRLQGASSATVSDYMQFIANTTETDLIVDGFKLATATGTAAALSGVAISFEPEDATGSEKQADIQVQMTDATRASADTDFIFRQNVAGAITERVRFDADASNILLSGATPYITIGDAGAEDTKIVFDGNAADYHIGLDDTGGVSENLFTLGVGSALGTTPALAIDSSANVTVTNDVTFRASLLAMGRVSASSSLASSSTSIGSSSCPYAVVRKFLSSGAEATTLPNGIAGQVLTLVVVRSGGGVWTVTPSQSTIITSFTMTAEDDMIALLYLNDTLGWIVLGSEGSTAITYNTKYIE